MVVATAKPMTKEAATKELIDWVCGKAINEADVPTATIDRIEKKVKTNDPSGDLEFLAYVAGLSAGSTAVARRWVERNPASAVVYIAGAKAAEKVLKSKTAA